MRFFESSLCTEKILRSLGIYPGSITKSFLGKLSRRYESNIAEVSFFRSICSIFFKNLLVDLDFPVSLSTLIIIIPFNFLEIHIFLFITYVNINHKIKLYSICSCKRFIDIVDCKTIMHLYKIPRVLKAHF